MTDLAREAHDELAKWAKRSGPFAAVMVEILRDLAVDLEQSGAEDYDELDAFREQRARRNITAAGNFIDMSYPQVQASRVAYGQSGCLDASEE